MSKMDLDYSLNAVQARDAAKTLRNIAASAFHVPEGYLSDALVALELDAMTLADTPALVAELRAARDVVAEAQAQGHGPDTDNPNCVQCKAVTAYLKVTGEPSQ